MQLMISLVFLFAIISFLIGLFICLPYIIIRRLINRQYKPFISIKILLLILVSLLTFICLYSYQHQNKINNTFAWQKRDLPELTIDFPFPIKKNTNAIKEMGASLPASSNLVGYINRNKRGGLAIAILEFSKPDSSINSTAFANGISNGRANITETAISGKMCNIFTTPNDDNTAYEMQIICDRTEDRIIAISISRNKDTPQSYVERIVNSIVFK